MRNIVIFLIPILFIIPNGIHNNGENDRILIPDINNPMIKDSIQDYDISKNLKGDYFTENKGQKSVGAGYYFSNKNPLSIGFGKGWIAYDITNPDNTSGVGGVGIRTNFLECNLVEPVGINPLCHKSNYFIGNDP
ncbi:MAG: hypothetical protein ACMUIE_00730, partial [Thermoplasmatota archaeon]